MFQISKLFFLCNPLYLSKIFTTWKAIKKTWTEDSIVILGYDGLKYLKKHPQNLTVTHDLLQNPENQLMQKHAMVHFYLIRMIF